MVAKELPVKCGSALNGATGPVTDKVDLDLYRVSFNRLLHRTDPVRRQFVGLRQVSCTTAFSSPEWNTGDCTGGNRQVCKLMTD